MKKKGARVPPPPPIWAVDSGFGQNGPKICVPPRKNELVLYALPGASRNQIRASILKDQEIIVARIGHAKSVLWTYDFQYKK